MRVLCPDCGFYHDVIRVVENGDGESRQDVFETASHEECTRRWMTEQDVLDARAQFGGEAIAYDDDDELV